MANIRKLSKSQDYKVALLYYLGGDDKQITELFNISKSAIQNRYAAHKRDIENKLEGVINLSKNRFSRGLEAYIKYGEVEDKFPSIKIKKREDSQEDALESILIDPLFEKAINETGINLALKEITPSNGYEQLISAIFGDRFWMYEYGIKECCHKLLNEYLKKIADKSISVRPVKILESFSGELRERLRKGYFYIESGKQKEIFDHIFNTISDREADIIKLYFGLDREMLTLEEIGEEYSLSRERVRQIKEKSIRRLRHTTKSKYLAYVLGHSDLEISKKIKEIDKMEKEVYGRIPLNVKMIEVDDLELSVRIHNALKAVGIRTIGDLMQRSAKDFSRLRNFGKKSLRELCTYLKEHYDVDLK